MAPRALTDQEKGSQYKKLLDHGKAVVMQQGIRKTSVEDIAKAAGIAKGSFYQHFETKERFLMALIWEIHRQYFAQAEEMIRHTSDLRQNLREFLLGLFEAPELVFMQRYHQEIEQLFESLAGEEGQGFREMENRGFARLLAQAGIDTNRVKPGVVHNYVHALYLAKSSDMMWRPDMQETLERMVDGLALYVFGGAQ